LRLQREQAAALDRLAIEQHGARAALRGVAADVSAGQRERAAQQLDQQGRGFDVGFDRSSVEYDAQCRHEMSLSFVLVVALAAGIAETSFFCMRATPLRTALISVRLAVAISAGVLLPWSRPSGFGSQQIA